MDSIIALGEAVYAITGAQGGKCPEASVGADAILRGISEAEYSDGLWYLPAAMRYSVDNVFDSRVDQLLETVAWFIRGWWAQIVADGVDKNMVSAWVDVLARYDGTSPYFDLVFDITPLPADLTGLDRKLNCLTDPQIDPSHTFLNEVTRRWAYADTRPARGVAVLDFCARVRNSECDMTIYRAPPIRLLAFDEHQIRAIYDAAHGAFDRRYGETSGPLVLATILGD